MTEPVHSPSDSNFVSGQFITNQPVSVCYCRYCRIFASYPFYSRLAVCPAIYQSVHYSIFQLWLVFTDIHQTLPGFLILAAGLLL